MFDYFYGNEPKQFAYYSIPQVLFIDEKFKKLSCESKVLYGLLLDKAGLSFKHGWTDEDGKVYVYFKREDVCEMLGCKRDKATKILAELDEGTGIGLIKRVAQGQGKPTKIYVRHFLRTVDVSSDSDMTPVNADIDNENAGDPASENDPEDDSDNKTALLGAEKPPSKGRKNRPLEDGKTALHNISHTKRAILSEPSYLIDQEPMARKPPYESCENNREAIDEMEYHRKLDEVKERIEYSSFAERSSLGEVELIDELVEVIVWAELTHKQSVRLGGDDISSEIVRKRLSQLDFYHIEYVLDCLKENTSRIVNRKNYLLTCLFNAPLSKSGYYQNLVNNDMAERYMAEKI